MFTVVGCVWVRAGGYIINIYYHIYGSNRLIAFHSIFERRAAHRSELDSFGTCRLSTVAAFVHTISAHSQLRIARWRSKAFDNSQYICICSLQSIRRSAHLRISSAQIKHSAEFSMFVVRNPYDSNRIWLIFYIETTTSRCTFWHNCGDNQIVSNGYIKISF